MKTNLVVSLIAGAVVIVGGGYYLTSSHAAAPAAADTQSADADQGAQAAEQEQLGAFSGSFADLAARGGSWKCIINTGTSQAISSGVAYVWGTQVRGDFTSTISGYGSIESHIATDGQYAYTWSSMMPQGIKVKLAAAGSGTGSGSAAGSSVSANSSYSYDCQPWTADKNVFVPPADVTFTTAPGSN